MWNDGLPRNGITNWSVFYASQGTDTSIGWQSWSKPLGCSWVYIFAQAAGSGGARLANGAQTSAGGGGAAGGRSRLLIPAMFLPDVIYIRPGAGGEGGTSASLNGKDGIDTWVCVEPRASAGYEILFIRGAFGAIGSAGGIAGSAGVATVPGVALGLFTTQAGFVGRSGATTLDSAGGSLEIGENVGSYVGSGRGGGNGTGAGGAVLSAAEFQGIPGGSGSTGGAGLTGYRAGVPLLPGWKSTSYWLFSGGTGGGGFSGAGTAGRGGDAAYGGGGGGGGTSTDASGVSGDGGRGGDGFVMVGAF